MLMQVVDLGHYSRRINWKHEQEIMLQQATSSHLNLAYTTLQTKYQHTDACLYSLFSPYASSFPRSHISGLYIPDFSAYCTHMMLSNMEPSLPFQNLTGRGLIELGHRSTSWKCTHLI